MWGDFCDIYSPANENNTDKKDSNKSKDDK